MAPFSRFAVDCDSLNYQHDGKFPGTLFATLDAGIPGNNACWIWYFDYQGRRVLVEYESDLTNRELITRNLKKYRGRMIYTFPWDFTIPSVRDGVSNFLDLQKWVNDKGYNRRVELRTLPKTEAQGRKNLLMMTLNSLPRFAVCTKGCEKGLEALASVRLVQDKKTLHVDLSKFVKNGFQHAADSLMYIDASLRNNIVTVRDQVMHPKLSQNVRIKYA